MRSNIEKSGGQTTPAPGLGQDAFFVSPDASSSALYILTKTHLLLLTVTLPDATQQTTQTAEKTLAAQILPKL
jgi:hypothetical protein